MLLIMVVMIVKGRYITTTEAGGNKRLTGRSLLLLAFTNVVLFVIANVAYGSNGNTGFLHAFSNVTWVAFLIGMVLLIVLGLFTLVQSLRPDGGGNNGA